MDRPEEEEAPVREDDPVGGGVRGGRGHDLPVLVPVDDGLRVTGRL